MTRPAVLDDIAAAAGAALDRTRPAAEQLELLPTRHEEGTAAHQRMISTVARGRGRPEGARNIATAQTIDFVRRVFGDPLIESARWLLHTPETLASELGCTALEAFDRQEGIRRDLRRYCHAQLASIDSHGNAVPPALAVIIGGGSGQVSSDGTVVTPWDRASKEMKQIQGFSGSSGEPSHGEPSHAGENDDKSIS